ncbi:MULTISPECIES: hypothetical protein [Legionella]|uniref:Apolipoprotein A1/A4/E domain protein n=1 Tax=Legionella drozanskii LLAP-1 TaxID=1212489 RepID=A0A0W0TE06_9GAMM|nr:MULTISPECIES: hypothetical protein [Legionella]KTC93828.1 hypothetical protein Ldro_0178 [Legionella drozanskii LLAP-1]PJE05550.1 MAG: hypothetical protein CK430_15490 [Legionella sp.]
MRYFFAFIFSLFTASSGFAADASNHALSILSSPELIVFLGLISTSTVYFFFKSDRFSIIHGPEILTTLGILGCFLGIALALLEFNSNNITSSVPALLEGIKTAFWSSVAGISGALIVRVRHKFSKNFTQQTGKGAKQDPMDSLIKEIVNLRKTLSGDEDGSLLSQVKMLRQDSNDQQKKLQDSFDNFAKHMIENNQKALIEALKEVIKDFNQNLTDQFGENFKQLNQAVEKLVIWQQQYKEELDVIKRYQSQFANDMKQSSEAFATVVEHAKEFTDIAQNLKLLLESMDKQKDVLFIQEKALSELLSTMKDLIPEFSENTSKMLSEIANGVKHVQLETVKVISDYSSEIKNVNNEMKNTLTDVIKGTHNSLADGLKDSVKIIQESVQEVQSQTAEVIKNHGSQLQSTQAEMKNVLIDGINKAQQEVTAGLQENAKIIREGVLALDKELEKSLTDSLTSLGKQLASLSEKFVQDYLPLTERLREVVRLAKKSEAT